MPHHVAYYIQPRRYKTHFKLVIGGSHGSKLLDSLNSFITACTGPVTFFDNDSISIDLN